jgi:hypothetical protein
MNQISLTTSIGWIDFSPTHRNRVGTVLDLLRPEGMVDELGLGTIRDALANQLFPGISTIQTRAKYFFIIPYILYEYQQLPFAKRKNKTASQFLEQKEYEIMWQLSDTYNHEEGHGVIGISKYKPEKIVRRPSAIYWNGLYNFRFIDTRGLAADAFLRQATRQNLSDLLSASKEGDDAPRDDADAGFENQFKLKVPPKKNWDVGLNLVLTTDEAEIFRDKVLSVANYKLLAELLLQDKLWDRFTKSENFMQFAKAAIPLRVSVSINRMMTLAHDFSELMYGAHLYYNYLLQQKVFKSTDYWSAWNKWVDQLPNTMINYAEFNPDYLFHYALTTRPTTASFVKEWWQQANSGFKNHKKLEQLILLQEASAKRNKARLQWNKTEDVRQDGWIGLTRFDYRFIQARTILNDIKEGL